MINTVVASRSLFVSSPFAFRSLFDSSPFALRYAFVIPPLCLRYVIASLTEVDRVHYGGWTKNERMTNEARTRGRQKSKQGVRFKIPFSEGVKSRKDKNRAISRRV